jgi:arylsulfatase A-like enzyme
MYGYGVDENGATVDYGSSPRDYQTDVLARYATDFVRRSAAGRRPFFLTLTPVAPHDDSSIPKGRLNPVPGPGDRARVGGLPLPHPPGFGAAIKDEPSELHRKPLSADELRSLTLFYRGRIGSLLAVDRAVRDLVGTLRSTGELANTVIIFTSDNGFLLGEHRHKGKEQPYEPSVRVPLIIRGPGFPSGVTRDELVANIDLAPTIRQLAGLDWRSHTDGIPLRPVARASGTYAGRPIIFERSQSEGKPYTALRTGRYAYVLWHSHHTVGPQELFDLKRDPYELRNVAPDPAYVRPLGVLRRELQSRRDCSGEKCRIPAPPIPAPSG